MSALRGAARSLRRAPSTPRSAQACAPWPRASGETEPFRNPLGASFRIPPPAAGCFRFHDAPWLAAPRKQ